MATYLCACKTNKFRVTDENKYLELFGRLTAEDYIDDFTKESEDGFIRHGFGCYSSIEYPSREYEGEYDFDEFIRELQSILPDDEAFMYFETGHEKLRSVDGYCVIATNKEVRSINLYNWAKNQAKELLGEDFETETIN